MLPANPDLKAHLEAGCSGVQPPVAAMVRAMIRRSRSTMSISSRGGFDKTTVGEACRYCNPKDAAKEDDLMSEANFTPEDWEQVRAAPLYVATYVLTASTSGPPGVTRKLFALPFAAEELKQDTGALRFCKNLLAESAGEAQPDAHDATTSNLARDPADRERLLDEVKMAVALIDLKAGDNAATIKRWVYSVGEQMARAAKGGGFLGLGGKLASDEENAALGELSVVMA
jgi:hypothetical protein